VGDAVIAVQGQRVLVEDDAEQRFEIHKWLATARQGWLGGG
jgi:hypothetical protein